MGDFSERKTRADFQKVLVSKKLSLGGGGGGSFSPLIIRKNYRAILKIIELSYRKVYILLDSYTNRRKMKLLQKISTGLGLSPYTTDDVAEEAQKMGADKVTITAVTRRFPMTEDRHSPGEYQPVAVIGDREMRLGEPIAVDFNPVEGVPGPMDLRHRVIEGKQLKAKQTLQEYVEALSASGVNANYKDFDRTY